jgi:hypothetical protein
VMHQQNRQVELPLQRAKARPLRRRGSRRCREVAPGDPE